MRGPCQLYLVYTTNVVLALGERQRRRRAKLLEQNRQRYYRVRLCLLLLVAPLTIVPNPTTMRLHFQDVFQAFVRRTTKYDDHPSTIASTETRYLSTHDISSYNRISRLLETVPSGCILGLLSRWTWLPLRPLFIAGWTNLWRKR